MTARRQPVVSDEAVKLLADMVRKHRERVEQKAEEAA